jgi:galactosamine-6-phosphate isomerase
MTISVFEDDEALSLHVADEILAAVSENPGATLCLAAGDTPTRAYALLVERARARNIDFGRCFFIGLDEWVGVPPANEGSCEYYLKKNLFGPLGITSAQMHLFDAMTGDLKDECVKMNRTIGEKGGIDLMLVGVGMNGHIGFNEPGVPMDEYAHIVDLDATTQSVGQKYFRQSTTLRQGITLGLKHFLESRRGILMASGIRKAEVIRQALTGPVTAQMPASCIQKHPNGVAVLDAEAAGLLEGEMGGYRVGV